MRTDPATRRAAELTLQIVCFLQSEPDAPRSSARWMFVPSPRPWPGGRGYTFPEAAAYLAGVEKPVIVGALNHPGYLALWRPSALDEAERQYVERLLVNQREALASSLANFDVGEGDNVAFEGWGGRIDVPVPVLRRWLGDYGLTWGWTLGAPTDDTHRARLLVLHSGRRWSPGDRKSAPSRER